MIGGRPDEQRLDCLDRASEESDARGSGFVRERLGRQSTSFDDDRRPGERLIALADSPITRMETSVATERSGSSVPIGAPRAGTDR